jgi:hypothetical protein
MSIASWTSPPASARHQQAELLLLLADELAEAVEDLAAGRSRH